MAKKSTKANFDARTQEVQRAIIQGFTRSDIHTYCKQKWNITSTRSSDKLYDAALKKICEDGKAELEEYRAEQVSRLKDLLRTMSATVWYEKEVKDATGKMKIVRTPNDTVMRHYLATVRHLSRITGIETIRIDDPNKMTNEELKAFLTDFYSKLDVDS